MPARKHLTSKDALLVVPQTNDFRESGPIGSYLRGLSKESPYTGVGRILQGQESRYRHRFIDSLWERRVNLEWFGNSLKVSASDPPMYGGRHSCIPLGRR